MPQRREAPISIVVGRNRSGTAITRGLILKQDVSEGTDAVEAAAAASDTLIGVAMTAIADGANGDVMQLGLAVVTSGAAISVNDRLTSDANGKAVAAAADNDHIIGVAKTAAAGANEDVECDLVGPGAQRGL